MTVRLDGEVVRLEGHALLEEAETLARLLQAPGRSVDLAACDGLHGAVVQALLAFGPPLLAPPKEPFLRDILVPALDRTRPSVPGATTSAGLAIDELAPQGARGRSPF